jgi:hypothetical protein
VAAYRLYYANEKRDLFEWSRDRSPPPGWRSPGGRPVRDGIDALENRIHFFKN